MDGNEPTFSGEEEQAEVVRQYLPDWQVGDDHGRLVHTNRYNSQPVEAADHLSGEQEDGVGMVRRYIPAGWMVGDDQGRLVHVKHYNARMLEAKPQP